MFKIIEIVDWNVVKVFPDWNYSGYKGSEVILEGYDISNNEMPSVVSESICVQRLEGCFLGKEVNLITPAKIEEGRLKCVVKCDGSDISIYFPDYQKRKTNIFKRIYDRILN